MACQLVRRVQHHRSVVVRADLLRPRPLIRRSGINVCRAKPTAALPPPFLAPRAEPWDVGHEYQLPRRHTGGIRSLEDFTFGGGVSAPLDEGVYLGATRVVARILQESIALESGDDIDLCIDPFAHRQLYTALSHVRHRADPLALFEESNQELKTCVNVVYQKLLL